MTDLQNSSPNLDRPGTTTYPNKTERIRAWSELIKAVSKFLWIGVIALILLQITGRLAVSSIGRTALETPQPAIVEVTVAEPKTSQLSAEVAEVLNQALGQSRESATQNLARWQSEVLERVDHPFLDWYYNYFTQLDIGLKAIWINLTSPSDAAKAERLIEGFQREFTKQVFQPSTMQLEMERFTREAVNAYVAEANQGLAGLQSRYAIPQPDWDRFLEGLSFTVYSTGSQGQDLSLRAISRGTGYLATVSIMKVASTVGSQKIAAAAASKTASKAAAKVATKTASKVAAEGGGLALGTIGLELINPLAGLGILVWDVWDHYHTVKVDRPIMYENLQRYLDEVTDLLLNDPESGILSTVNRFHNGVMDSLVAA